jgi:hypothetical protein
MNVEIGAEAALFPEKEYINRIAVAVGGLRIRNIAENRHFLTQTIRGKLKKNMKMVSIRTEATTLSKRLVVFPSPAGMSLTKSSLDGKNSRESLMSDFPAGDGKTANLFFTVHAYLYIHLVEVACLSPGVFTDLG